MVAWTANTLTSWCCVVVLYHTANHQAANSCTIKCFPLCPSWCCLGFHPGIEGSPELLFQDLACPPYLFPLLSWSPYPMLNAHSVSVGMVKVLPKLKRLGWLMHTNCNTKWSLPLNAIVSPLVWCFAAPCGHFELVTVKDNTFFWVQDLRLDPVVTGSTASYYRKKKRWKNV